MPVVVEIASSSGDRSLGVSHWNNSVALSLRRDGHVSVFGYGLLADEQGKLRRTLVFRRVGIRDGAGLDKAIQEAVEAAGCEDAWAPDRETFSTIEEHCPTVARGLREVWGDYLDGETRSA